MSYCFLRPLRGGSNLNILLFTRDERKNIVVRIKTSYAVYSYYGKKSRSKRGREYLPVCHLLEVPEIFFFKLKSLEIFVRQFIEDLIILCLDFYSVLLENKFHTYDCKIYTVYGILTYKSANK